MAFVIHLGILGETALMTCPRDVGDESVDGCAVLLALPQ